ncbi:MAG: tetratricopeptide repeat protein [Acidobacteriota bacterium]
MRRGIIVGIVAAFAVGVVTGLVASTAKADKSLFENVGPREAAANLLGVAQLQAGKGSWENIGVARVYYLMGEKDHAREILDRVMKGKLKESDWMRIGRLYAEANEWPQAKEAFDKAIEAEPKDGGNLAEVGAWYNLHGDRAHAEELFGRAFGRKDDDVWVTANVAGSYVGVKPE